MYGRALFFVVLIVVGAVLPYLLADENWLADVERWFSRQPAVAANEPKPAEKVEKLETVSSADPIATRYTSVPQVPAEDSGIVAANRELLKKISGRKPAGEVGQFAPGLPGRALELPNAVGPPGIPMEHLLSFEVTPNWVGDNWSRVTTRLAELELQGWRVPIARDDDFEIVGSITYYFDQQRLVQRILLHGYTNDATPFVRMAMERYGMRRVPSSGDLFAANVDGQTIGALQCEYAAIMTRGMNDRCELTMELNRRASKYGLSQEFRKSFAEAKRQQQVFSPVVPTGE